MLKMSDSAKYRSPKFVRMTALPACRPPLADRIVSLLSRRKLLTAPHNTPGPLTGKVVAAKKTVASTKLAHRRDVERILAVRAAVGPALRHHLVLGPEA